MISSNECISLFFFWHTGVKTAFPNGYYGFVDIRDVVKAHIQAFEIPSASGRYCIVGKVTDFAEVLKIVHEIYPTLLPLDDK